MPEEKKPVNMEISADVPDGATRVAIVDGRPHFVDAEGNKSSVLRSARTTFFDRSRKRKVQSDMTLDGQSVTVGGLEELTSLDAFYVIDTNHIEIQETKVATAAFIGLRLHREGEFFRVEAFDQSWWCYEFHGVTGNPEMFSIFILTRDIEELRRREGRLLGNIGIVTDSELGLHDAITRQQCPLFGEHFLPKGFRLMYASAETGQELVNRIMKIIDGASKRHLAKIKLKGLRSDGMQIVSGFPDITSRCVCYPDVRIDNPIIKPTMLSEGAKLTIHFHA